MTILELIHALETMQQAHGNIVVATRETDASLDHVRITSSLSLEEDRDDKPVIVIL